LFIVIFFCKPKQNDVASKITFDAREKMAADIPSRMDAAPGRGAEEKEKMLQKIQRRQSL
jgi:hypothetical protein